VFALLIIIAFPVLQIFSGGLLSAGINFTSLGDEATESARGLLITSSGLYCALKNDQSGNTAAAVDLQSIFLPGSSVLSFAGVTGAIEKAKPDFIVLQGAVLTKKARFSKPRRWVHQLKRYWIVTLSSIHPFVESVFLKLHCTFSSVDESTWDGYVEAEIVKLQSLSSSDKKVQEEFVNTLLAFGKPVIIVNQPYPGVAQDYRQVISNAVTRVISRVRTAEHVHQLRYRAVHGNSQFPDPFHPSPELSTIFSRWFNNEVNRLIK